MSLGQSSHKSAEDIHTHTHSKNSISDFFPDPISILVASNTVPVSSGVTPVVRQCFIAGLVTSVMLEQLHNETVGGYTY